MDSYHALLCYDSLLVYALIVISYTLCHVVAGKITTSFVNKFLIPSEQVRNLAF